MTNQNPLTPLLIDLASARAEEQAAKASTALLAKEEIVQTYLGTVAETRIARQNNRTSGNRGIRYSIIKKTQHVVITGLKVMIL